MAFVIIAFLCGIGGRLHHRLGLINDIEACGGVCVAKYREPAWYRKAPCGRWLRAWRDIAVVKVRQDAAVASILACVRQLGEVEQLDLTGSDIDDQQLQMVAGIASLRAVYLNRTRIGDRGMGELARLQKLKVLEVANTNVTDEGIKTIGVCRDLYWVVLADVNVTDACIETFRTLDKMEFLDLDGTDVSDAGIRRMSGRLSLKYLRVCRTRCTMAGVDAFQRDNPDVCIYSGAGER